MITQPSARPPRIDVHARFLPDDDRAAALAADDGADLAAFPDADGFASFLAAAGSGLKHVMRTEEAFRSAIHRLARVAAYTVGLA